MPPAEFEEKIKRKSDSSAGEHFAKAIGSFYYFDSLQVSYCLFIHGRTAYRYFSGVNIFTFNSGRIKGYYRQLDNRRGNTGQSSEKSEVRLFEDGRKMLFCFTSSRLVWVPDTDLCFPKAKISFLPFHWTGRNLFILSKLSIIGSRSYGARFIIYRFRHLQAAG